MLPWQRLGATAAFALLTPALAVAASGSGETRSTTRRVRVTEARLEQALDEGVARSATLRALVEDLERSDVIVHITPQLPSQARNGGEIQFVAVGGGTRYLRITIKQDLPFPALVAMIGHELQHAVEIADAPAVTDHATLRRHYEAIGFSPERGMHETDEAREIGARVLREFRTGRR